MANANFIANAVRKSLSQIDESFTIRPKQLEAIINIVNGHDTLAILPTSYGKSLIFRLIPSVCKQLRGHTNQAIVAVIAPLESIIKDQIDSANKLFMPLGIRACQIDSANLNAVKDEGFNILIGTPEAWLESDAKELLSLSYFQKHLKCLVVDEAHLVSWGHSDNSNEQPFREAFGRIGELRSFLCEHVPILCLSATVDQNNFDLISGSCGVSKKGFRTVFSCSDRPNIKLSIFHCEEKSVYCFQWVINLIKNNGIDCPKILIFCRTQILCGWLYDQFLLCSLGSSEKFLGLYHANSWPHKKDSYLKSLTSSDEGDHRVIICSSALGCGVDCQDVKFVLHFGPPHNLVDYVQQIGRAGRSNAPDCHAALYNFPQSTKIANDVRNYMDHTGCLRKKLFNPFSEKDTEISSIQPAHVCCSNCAQDCNCGEETCKQTYFDVTSDENKPLKVRNITDENCVAIQSSLAALHEKIIQSSSMFVPSGIISGLTNEIIFEVVRHLKFIDSADYITNNLPVVSETLAKNIFDIILNHFENTPLPAYEPKTNPNLKKGEPQYEFGDFEFDSDFSLEEDSGGFED